MSSSTADTFVRMQYVLEHSVAMVRSDAGAAANLLGLPRLRKNLRERCSTRQGLALVVLSALFAVALLAAAAAWTLSPSAASQAQLSCPAAPAAASRKVVIRNGPTDLLMQAQSGNSQALKQCLAWTPAKGSLPPMEQVRAQLQCHAAFLEAGSDADGLAGFLIRAKQALGAVEGVNQRCSGVRSKLRALSGSGAAVRQPVDAVVTLGGLANFESSVREASQTLDLIVRLVHEQGGADSAELASALALRSKFSSCVFQTTREARKMAHVLPRANSAIRQVQLCRPDMLGGLERLALFDMQADFGSMFSKGMLLSESAIAPADAPLFGDHALKQSSDWMIDTQGTQAPKSIVYAEQMLINGLDGVPAAEAEESAKSLVMQMAAHAKLMTQLKQYEAAEWRYRTAIQVAKKHGVQKLESSGLAQLSYFLSMHGSQEQALEAAKQSLELSDDALALYLQASLQLSLGGELRSEEQVRTASEQLKSLAGKLPTEELEQSRAAAVQKLEAWRAASENASLSACLDFQDAAQVLICTAGKVAQVFGA